MSTLAQDLRHAMRGLRRRPAFAALVVLTLGLGVGADAAIFAVARGILFAPFPYRDAERVVTVWSRWEGFPKTWVSVDEARLYRRDVPSLETLALYDTGGANLGGDDAPPTRIQAAAASAEIFAALGVEPVLGRAYTVEEDRADARVAVISHALFERRLGGRVEALGSRLVVDGNTFEVIGVLPPGVRLPEDFRDGSVSDLWAPLAVDLSLAPEEKFGGGDHSYFAVGRIARDASIAGFAGELAGVAARRVAAKGYPEEWRFEALGFALADDVVGAVAPVVGVLSAAVAFVLLLAAANAVHLLVGRLQERTGELAVRTALGGSRARLVRLLAVETTVLAAVSGLVGLGVARAALAALRALAPPGLPRLDGVALDGPTVAFAFAVALGTGLAVSLLAARQALRGDVAETLRSGRSRVAVSRRRRGGLVAIEMATAVVLLVGAGLMLRTVESLLAIDPGFRPEGALTLRLQLAASDYARPADVAAFVDRAREGLAALPGVEAAGAVRILPLATSIGDRGVEVEGYTPRAGEATAADWQVLTPGAVEALGMRVVAGRSLGEGERWEGGPSVLVNEAFARRYWPGLDPVGRRFRLRNDEAPWATVVGVVADLRHNDLLQPVKPSFYWPHAQFAASTGATSRGLTVVLRTAGDPMALAAAARAVLAELDPRLPVAELRTLAEAAAVATAPSRFAAGILLALSSLALVLAAVGVYGVLARAVAQRTREIGVRAALGARPREIVLAIAREGLGASLLGLGAGLLAAAGLTRFLAGMVHGVSVHDPATFAGVPLLLAVVALAACLVPAWRASRVDAATALRSE